ncbi:HAD family hydrolase [Candidatus Harpocratesius sp.]
MMKRFRGVIFDCDGVLVNSEPWSCGAWNVVFQREYRIDIGTNYDALLGKTTQEVVEFFFHKFNLNYSPEVLQKISTYKEQVYQEIAHGKIVAIPGVKDLLKYLKTQSIPRILASSGIRSKVEFNLTESGLSSYFTTNHIISADDIKMGKPDPEIFLVAAERLKIPIYECIVIEDSQTGVSAGKASGAFTIAITTSFPRDKLSEADLIIDSFSDLDFHSLF